MPAARFTRFTKAGRLFNKFLTGASYVKIFREASKQQTNLYVQYPPADTAAQHSVFPGCPVLDTRGLLQLTPGKEYPSVFFLQQQFQFH